MQKKLNTGRLNVTSQKKFRKELKMLTFLQMFQTIW
jgi:hypothetical protein